MRADNEQGWTKEIFGRFEECEEYANVPAPYRWLTDDAERHGAAEFTRHRHDEAAGLHRYVSVYVAPNDLAASGALVEIRASVSDDVGAFHDLVVASGEMDAPQRVVPVLVSAIEAAEAMTPADLDQWGPGMPRPSSGA